MSVASLVAKRPYDLIPGVTADGERVVELKFAGIGIAFAVESKPLGFWTVMVARDATPSDVDTGEGGFTVLDRGGAVAALESMAGLYLSGFQVVAL
ncbi:hypothetical protein EV580_1360 [Mycobacterium sp. BK086]|uniref:hypothetical protein n=1 Tax=Mycobacterium sp. BK086 TaxID=2512165 RepID=UPI0010615D88|nr:hypothetical protein [Mycobacterium sp. BK086]TDO18176.1 hypothetical protein EV580_1360 [Mycobacterium sp. BK086]